jgi:hypothetical protein
MSNEADEQAAAVAELKRQMSEVRALRQSISVDELENAITQITAFLRTSSDTGGGRRLQQFSGASGIRITSSICTISRHIPVAPLTDAVITMFREAMVGILTETQTRRLLTDSGELARWEHVCSQTPEDEEVLYPPPPASAEFLITLGVSAQRSKKRAEDERRSA